MTTQRQQSTIHPWCRILNDLCQRIHSFRECLHRRHLQPADGILFCFMQAQQAAIQFCERTRVDNMFHGLLLFAVTEWRWGKTPFMHFSTTWALTCAGTVQQCPGVARHVEARLLDSRVAYKMTVDHSSRQPVFFPLRSLVDRSCVCSDRASSYKSFMRVIKHIGIQRPVRMKTSEWTANENHLQTQLTDVMCRKYCCQKINQNHCIIAHWHYKSWRM